MQVSEKEFRERLIRQARRRARQIEDGSFVNEPWAPSVGLSMMFGEEPDNRSHRRVNAELSRLGVL